jgi:hypothetical protein
MMTPGVKNKDIPKYKNKGVQTSMISGKIAL